VRTELDHCVKVTTLEERVKMCTLTLFESGVHAFEWPCYLWFEMTVKFAEVGCEVRKVSIDYRLVFVYVIFLHLLL
jgi:hypothetical protein